MRARPTRTFLPPVSGKAFVWPGGVGARSVAFPAVSAGIYGWDARQVAETARDAVNELAAVAAGSGSGVTSLEVVEFVLFSEETTAVFRTVFGA